MPSRAQKTIWVLAISILLLAAAMPTAATDANRVPAFGRDTVLVWKIQNQEFVSSFVVRVAEFLPNRFVEWEDEKTQGTIFMPSRDLQRAKGYVSSNLFEAGMDMKGKNTTTLWLSQQIFRDLKEKKWVKIDLDGVRSRAEFKGEDYLTVEVNRLSAALPVIKVLDDRGSVRWFLDQEENPLMVKHELRHFSQTLVSITTDRPNTLRWIKGSKLVNPPR
jgi:hypothetical protein